MKRNIFSPIMDALLSMPVDIFCNFVFIYLFKLNDEQISNVKSNFLKSDIYLFIGDKFFQEKESYNNEEKEN